MTDAERLETYEPGTLLRSELRRYGLPTAEGPTTEGEIRVLLRHIYNNRDAVIDCERSTNDTLDKQIALLTAALRAAGVPDHVIDQIRYGR
jgi:hypothetical protein